MSTNSGGGFDGQNRWAAARGCLAIFLMWLSAASDLWAADATLAWDPNPEPDVVGYQLHYGTSMGDHPQVLDAGTQTTVTVSGLTPGVTYYFVVCAVNGTGLRSATSNEIAYTPPVVAAVTFSSWAAPLPAAAQAPLATPQNDGVPNLLKYAFAMHADRPDHRTLTPGTGNAGLPAIERVVSDNAPMLRFEFVRRKNSQLVYTPRKSSDLKTWEPLTPTAPSAVTDIDGEWERVVVAEPCNPDSRAVFGRVDVTLPNS